MRRLVAVVIAAVVLTACGATEADVSLEAERALAGPVRELRVAATAGDVAGARARISAIRSEVSDLEESGDLSEDGAARIRRGVDEVERRLASIAATSTTTTTTTPGAAPPSTVPPSTVSPPTGPPTTAAPTTQPPLPSDEEGGRGQGPGNGGDKGDKGDKGGDDAEDQEDD